MGNRRIFILALLIYGCILGSLWTLDNNLLILSIPLVIYLGAVILYQPGKLDLVIQRHISKDTGKPGDPVVVTVKITNNGSRLDELHISDTLPEGLSIQEGQPQEVISLLTGESHSYQYTITGFRGHYEFDAFTVSATDHFGLFHRHDTRKVNSKLIILPDFERLRVVPIRPSRTRGFAGSIPSRQSGSGTAFFGVREYQQGDSRHLLNWRLSARSIDKLYSNEFEQERIADVGIILDARKRTNVTHGSESIFDYAITASSSLADMLLREGHRVALLIYGRGLERTYPGYGKYQRDIIMRALSHANVGDSMVFDSFDYLPTRFFPAKSQIIIVSPLCEEDSKVLSRIKSRGYNILVISPDPVSYEAVRLPPSQLLDLGTRIALSQRILWIHNLQRMSIPVVDWDTRQSLDNALQAAIRTLRRGYL
ncbi:MAG: DUF58 domain-containing protein [Anaerolineae bacterium]|nr:DUF58 domain-containing protein [Anaerolineae bacterium]